MGCLDSFKCCSFPHGRDQAVQISLLVSTVAWICTVASMDAHGTILATLSWLFLQSTTCTTLSVTALSCAAMSCLITAAYNVRAIWLIAHIFGECREMESEYHQELEMNSSATEFNITLGGQNMTWSADDVEEMDFFCGDMDYFMVFAVLAAPLWLMTTVSVFYIPQPSYNNYTTLMDYLVTSPSSDSNNDNEQQQQLQPVTQRLFRGCCRSFAVGSFPHGKNANMLLLLSMTVLSTGVALTRHRFETNVLAVVTTGIVWASTATTLAPVVLHLAAMLGFLTSFFGFQAVYYIRVICPRVEEHPDGWVPDYCQYPTWFTVMDLTTGFLWLVTSLLIFTIPPPPVMDLEEWGATNDLDLQQEDTDHVELEDMKAGAMT